MKEKLEKDILEFLHESKLLTERHELMKAKWLDLGTQDLFDWVCINEKVANMITEGKSMYLENKRWLEVLKGNRRIELKAELNEDWKKKHTESTAEAVINNEFWEEDKLMLQLKEAYELLMNIALNIPEYINIVKLNMRILNPIQWL